MAASRVLTRRNASLSARVGYGRIEERGDDENEAGNDEQTYPRNVVRAVTPHEDSVLPDQISRQAGQQRRKRFCSVWRALNSGGRAASRPDRSVRATRQAASEPSTFVQGRWPLQHVAARCSPRPPAPGLRAYRPKMLDNGGGCPLGRVALTPLLGAATAGPPPFQQPAICGSSARLRHGAKTSTACKSATALSVGWRVVELVVVIDARLVLLR